jgi:DinB family protein
MVADSIGGLMRILLGSGPMSEDVNGRHLGPLLLGSLDYVWSRIRERLSGLTAEEYLWEPAPGCWSVRPGPAGGWQIEHPAPEPSPPPVTTIAWRLWHIGSECLAGYTSQGLGPWPLEVRDREWYATPEPAIKALDEAWLAFRAGLAELGEDGLWQPLGPQWDEFADDPWAGLVLHAQDEMSHHGAEIALLRDLYAVRR